MSLNDWSNIANVVMAALTFFGIVFVGYELNANNRARRAEFLMNTTQLFFSNPDIRQLYYDIDYQNFCLDTVDENNPKIKRCDGAWKEFCGSDDEKTLDLMLYTLDAIGRVVKLGVMSRFDAQIFAFQAGRVFDDSEVQKYLAWLDRQRAAHGGGERPPFRAARELAELRTLRT